MPIRTPATAPMGPPAANPTVKPKIGSAAVLRCLAWIGEKTITTFRRANDQYFRLKQGTESIALNDFSERKVAYLRQQEFAAGYVGRCDFDVVLDGLQSLALLGHIAAQDAHHLFEVLHVSSEGLEILSLLEEFLIFMYQQRLL